MLRRERAPNNPLHQDNISVAIEDQDDTAFPLDQLPPELFALVCKNSSLRALSTLRTTNKAFRDRVDSIIGGHWHSITALQKDKKLLQQTLKYYAYMQANNDPFIDILDECIAKKELNISSSALTQLIKSAMQELEDINNTRAEEPIQENNQRRNTQTLISLNQYRNSALFIKCFMIFAVIIAVIILLLPGVVSIYRDAQRSGSVSLTKLLALAFLVYLFYSFSERRFREFTRENIQYHRQVVRFANHDMEDIEAALVDKNVPAFDPTHAEKRIQYLWQNSKKILNLGIEQLKKPPTGTELLMPTSTINVEQLKTDWKEFNRLKK
jgi:uncharacterized protein with PQ loop repeat